MKGILKHSDCEPAEWPSLQLEAKPLRLLPAEQRKQAQTKADAKSRTIVWRRNLSYRPAPEQPALGMEAETLKLAIKRAYSYENVSKALRDISTIWEKLDETIRLAQARLSILLKRQAYLAISPPSISISVEDLLAPLSNLHNDENPVHPSLLETTQQVLETILCRTSLKKEAISVEKGVKGRVVIEIDLNNDKYLRWILTVSDLPWPGLNALCSAQVGLGPSANRTSRTLHLADDLVSMLGDLITK